MGRRKANRLVRPVIKEVSGVDHPAHLADGWVIWKSVDAPAPTDAELDELMSDPAYLADNGYDDEADGFDDDDEGDDVDAALAQELEATRAELATERARSAALEGAVTKAGGTVPGAEITKAVAKATADAAEEAAFTKAVAGAPPALADYLRSQRAEVLKAREIAEHEQALRVEREYLAVAKSAEWRGVGQAPEQLATTLRQIDALPADTATEVKRLLKAAGAQAAFSEIGGHGQQAPAGGAWGEIQQIAKELRTAHPDMTAPQAVEKATELNPELAARYRAEMRS